MDKGRRWRHALGALTLAMSLWVLAIAPVAANGGSVGGYTVGDPMAPGHVILKLFNAADLPDVAAQYQLDPAPLDRLPSAPLYLMRVLDGQPPVNVVNGVIAARVR